MRFFEKHSSDDMNEKEINEKIDEHTKAYHVRRAR